MGLLDDAIREHLDLKRRRGADPAEVERAEREALGPVRRNPAPGDGAGSAELADPYDEPEELEEHPAREYDVPGEDEWADEPAVSAAAPADTDPSTGSWSDTEPDTAGHEPVPAAPAAPPAPPAPAAPAGGQVGAERELGPHAGEDPALDAATAEYHVEEEPPPGADEVDDVLEETPEFLQDTPDHDRLWFEQRPPRDFDFDG